MESAYGWKILVPGVWWLSMACRLSHACMHTHVRKYEHMHLHNYMHRLSRHISSYTRQKQDILESDWLPLKPLTALVYHAYCTNILRSVTNPDTLPHSLQNRFCMIPRRQQQCGRRWDGIHAGLQNDVSNKPSNHSCRTGRNSSAGRAWCSRHEETKN